MTGDTDLTLGQRVTDTISGFEGVVTVIDDHLTGCTTAKVVGTPIGEETTSERSEWLREPRLELGEMFVDADPKTETEFELGEVVRDTVTGFEGIVGGVGYYLYNCPRIVVVPTAGPVDEKPESESFDETRVESLGEYRHTDLTEDDAATTETGSIGRTSSGRVHST